MKQVWLLAFTIVAFGCSEIVPGTCHPNPAGGAGGAEPMPIAGAGVGVSASGDFATDPSQGPLDIGDGAGGAWRAPPRQPQDAPPPDCLNAPQSPCEEKCLTDYKTAAGTCGNIENEAQRTSCQDGAYASYKGCRGHCQQSADCLEECKKQCDKENERCIKNCPKGDKACMDQCNQAYGRCLRECDQRCK